MQKNLFFFFWFAIFTNVYGQHARDGYSLWGAAYDDCECSSCPCLRIKIPYDEANNITGSPENCADSPRGLVNSVYPAANYSYVLIFNEEFNDLNPFLDTEITAGGAPDWTKKWFKTTSINPTTHPNNSIMATGGTHFENPDEANSGNSCGIVGTDKELRLRVDKVTLNDGSTQFRMSELVSALHFRYGYVEAKIKIPKGKGYWPAFWVYDSWNCVNGQPEVYSENDIFENFERNVSAQRPRDYHKQVITQHYSPSVPCNPKQADPSQHVVPMDDGGVGAYFLDFSADYFIYGMEWDPVYTKYYVNNTLVHTQSTKNTQTGMRVRLWHTLLKNFSNGGADIDNNTPFPAFMRVDYVRVYKPKTLWLNMIRGESEICAGQNKNMTPDAFIPGATYSWSITNNSATYPIVLTPGYDPGYGNRWANISVPTNTPVGSYNLRLTVTLASGTALPQVNKTINIYNSSPPATPGTISREQFCDACILSISPLANASQYEWLSGNTVIGDGLFLELTGGSYANNIIKVHAKNAYSTWSPYRLKSAFVCGNDCGGQVRSANPSDTLNLDSLQKYESTENLLPNLPQKQNTLLYLEYSNQSESLETESIGEKNAQKPDYLLPNIVYPQDGFIEIKVLYRDTEIGLRTITGSEIANYSPETGSFLLPVRNLSVGIYVLTIISPFSSQAQKLIIIP